MLRPDNRVLSKPLLLILAAVSTLLSACASRPDPATRSPESIAQEAASRRATEDLNIQLAQQAHQLSGVTHSSRGAYTIGVGDEIAIHVHHVPELQVTERVSASGDLNLPLVGRFAVGGLTAEEAEASLTELLARSYLQNPQVSLNISTFRAAEISVAGAVRNPGVYTIDRPRTVLEMLALAGGISETAGYQVHVQTYDRAEGEPRRVSLMVDLRELISNTRTSQSLILDAGDSVYVRPAGYVYVEGAVTRPGAYRIEGEANVLKALAQAGGTKFAAQNDEIRVFRSGPDGIENFAVDLDEIRANPSGDVVLRDGDVVVVGKDAIKSGLAGLWNGISGILRLGVF